VDPRTPTVHRNGTSRDALLEQRIDLADALRDSLRALREAEPNGRDYPGDPARLAAAIQRHRGRHDALQALLAEVEAEAEEISAQDC